MSDHAIRCHFTDGQGQVCNAVIRGRTDEEAQSNFDHHVEAEQRRGNGHR